LSVPGQNSNGDDLAPFVSAYSEAAHSAFLLALFQQAATYPANTACLAGAAMTAAWRLVAATASLIHIAANIWPQGSHHRYLYSAVFTIAELVTMIPILVAVSWLLLEAVQQQQQQQQPKLSSIYMYGNERVEGTRGKEEGPVVKELDCVVFVEDNDDARDFYQVELGQQVPLAMDGLMKIDAVSRFQCVTLSQIVSSEQFSKRQRWGAWVLSVGCVGLLVEMTIETAILLSQTFVGTDAEHSIYEWGMHTCVMYAFCSSMSVESSHVYQRARPLLAIACPAGTLIAIWQLALLLSGGGIAIDDPRSMAVAILIAWRAICGVVQTAGVLILDDTAPSDNRPALIQAMPTAEDDAVLESARVMATRALCMLFVPGFLASCLFSTLSGNCSEPMISPMLPPVSEGSCKAADMDLILKQNIPGLGLFFHFGMVIVLFTFDGISRSVPCYKPSLLIAIIWAGHTSLLLLVGLSWDMIQTRFWSSLLTDDVIRRVLLTMWSLGAGYLAFCLHRLWTLRQLPL
jgi:hypothetical protein